MRRFNLAWKGTDMGDLVAGCGSAVAGMLGARSAGICSVEPARTGTVVLRT